MSAAFDLGDLGEQVEQDCLAHATQPDRHDALPGLTSESTPYRGPEVVDELVTAEQRGRSRPCSGSERVAQLLNGN
ncbi:MAG: hypothetical protein AVDCRST_MAG76-2452 [uncultured Acidimicrobiales bacterium]|uniref:Uncharacterized protein n=1 Tax=uncultured Acidimicrobiales bacterium TaxID=310071 RepID=A0A6J4IM82_9ACTN|nr:MAG: hypothetical protein AVDCRST_MAG76-2452 [uncultured Acidimicrobiales bacterium]